MRKLFPVAVIVLLQTLLCSRSQVRGIFRQDCCCGTADRSLEPYFNDRLAIKLRRLNATLISSINRTPELKRWIEGSLDT